MGRKGFSHLINVGVGTGNSEFINIGVGEKVVGLGEYGDKEVEKSSSDLKHSHPDMKSGGEGEVVTATGGSPFIIGRERTFGVIA